jgi:hypothetical protein
MAGREHAQRLPRELGERIGLAGLGLDADGHVALGLDEVLVGLDVDDRTGVLPLYAHLGRPGGGETALYRAMLDANLFWRGPGGATLAREGGSGGDGTRRGCGAGRTLCLSWRRSLGRLACHGERI